MLNICLYFSKFFPAKRAHEFIGVLLKSTTARPVQMPPGLSTLQEELAHICGTLLRLVSHNRSVFGEYYANIIIDCIKARQSQGDKSTSDSTAEAKSLSSESSTLSSD